VKHNKNDNRSGIKNENSRSVIPDEGDDLTIAYMAGKYDQKDNIKGYVIACLKMYYSWKSAEGSGAWKWATERGICKDHLEMLVKHKLIKNYTIGDEASITWMNGVKEIVEVPKPRDSLVWELKQ
jgi:hypothetical protein